MMGLRLGVTNEDRSVERSGSNPTDERTEVCRSFRIDFEYVTYMQPRRFGVCASVNF